MSKPVRTYGRKRTEPPPSRMVFTPPPSSPPLSSLGEPSSPLPATSSNPLSTRDSNLPNPNPPNPTSKQSTLSSFFTSTSTKRKRPPTPPPSSPTVSTVSTGPTPARKKLTQLHFTQNSLRSCKDCSMSYIRGTDDQTHARHHARVVHGIPWTTKDNASSRSLSSNPRLVLLDLASTSGKLSEILATVDTVLSAPPLPPAIRSRCKLILAISSHPPKSKSKSKSREKKEDRVIGVVVAQGIKTAMRVLGDSEPKAGRVDSGGGVVCDPTPLPTPLGIHRLFVVPAYRGTGLARAMLDAAAKHTIYGCSFNPSLGEIAFSQPTQSGRAVMQSWGGGGIRVFVDDERQL